MLFGAYLHLQAGADRVCFCYAMYHCIGPAGELLRQVLSKPELLYLCKMSGLCAGLQAKATGRGVYVKV